MILRVIYYYYCYSSYFSLFLFTTASVDFCSFISSVDSFNCHCAEPNTSKIEENLIRVTINKWLKNPSIHYNSKGAAQIQSNVWDENLPRFRNSKFFLLQLFNSSQSCFFYRSIHEHTHFLFHSCDDKFFKICNISI